MSKNELNITRIMSAIKKAKEEIECTSREINRLNGRIEKSSSIEHINDLKNKVSEYEGIANANKETIISNTETIDNFIASCEGRCTARTCDFSDVKEFYARLSNRHYGMKKDSFMGCTYTYMPHAERLPNAYKYTSSATATALCFEQRKAGLYLTRVYRDNCNHAWKFKANYTEDAQRAIVDDFSNNL